MSQCLALPKHRCNPPRTLRTYVVVAQIKMSKRLTFPQRPCKPPRTLCPNVVDAQIKMGQRLALPQRPRKPPRTLRTDVVAAQIKIGQSPALPQHPCNTPSTFHTNVIVPQIKMSQHLALPDYPRKPPRPLRPNSISTQIEMGKCLALPQHQRQLFHPPCSNPSSISSGPCAIKISLAQVKMRQPLPMWPFENNLKTRNAIKVPDESFHLDFCLRPLHQKDCASVLRQFPPEQPAHPEPRHHPLRRPKPPQQSRWQADQLKLTPRSPRVRRLKHCRHILRYADRTPRHFAWPVLPIATFEDEGADFLCAHGTAVLCVVGKSLGCCLFQETSTAEYV
eukprot:2046859-Rhodomonas_salina.1